MKTLNRQLQSLVVVLFGFVATLAAQAESVSYTAEFDINRLDTTIQVVDGVSYIHLEYPGLHSGGAVGAPELPVCHLRFSVPYNATGFTVSATPSGVVSRTYAMPVYPVQPPVTCNATQVDFVHPDSAIYYGCRNYSTVLAEVAERGFLGGDNQIVTVVLNPFGYAPLTGELTLYSSISVTLSYTLDGGGLTKSSEANSGMQALTVQKTEETRQRDVELVSQMVVNPTQIAQFAPPRSLMRTSSASPTALPAYQYCVVTSRELAPAFDRLIAWKRQKGYNAGVVYIEDILVHADYQAGDVVSGINDDAGKLRAYLQDAYERGVTQYALLAGDYSVLPIRYATGIWKGNYPIPSDWYFCDFNGDWNVDGDTLYGEFESGQAERNSIDYTPEIYVGRLLCTNAQEIANYIEKLFRYEQNPGNGDFSYLKKAFYCQSDEMQDNYNQANTVIQTWGNVFTQNTVLQEVAGGLADSVAGPTGKAVILEMNNRYGFLSWHGHGAPTSITVSSRGTNGSPLYAIVPFDGILDDHSENYWVVPENGHGLDNLTNQDYPAIAYSISCVVTPFDHVDGYDIPHNIGSSFTVRGLYGGPAFLGNTREGYITSSLNLEKEFINEIKSGNYQIGVAEALSKSGTSIYKWCLLTHNLIGCPEFEMWTDIPVQYNDISIHRSNNSIMISSSELSGSKIGVISDANQPPVFVEAIGTTQHLNNVSPNSVITIYKHNAIPYIAPLYWQNDTISGFQYLVVHDVNMGEAVDANRSSGELVLNSGTITLNSDGDVQIDEGTVVEGNAHLVLKNKGSLVINGIVIQNGGELTIEGSGDVIIAGGSVCDGGTLNLECSGEIIVLDGSVEFGGTLNSNCDIQFIDNFEIKSGANVEFKAF